MKSGRGDPASHLSITVISSADAIIGRCAKWRGSDALRANQDVGAAAFLVSAGRGRDPLADIFPGGGMRVSLAVLMIGLFLLPGAPVRADETLPTDPALVTGTLPNGLHYIIRRHGNPEGRASIW